MSVTSSSPKIKIGLTGGTGFIGSAFLKQYADKYDIVLLNLRNDSYISQLKNLEAVVHCAGLAHQPGNLPKEQYFQVNYELTKKLANECVSHQVKQFIFLSTFHVKLTTQTFYSESKIAAEEYLQSLSSKILISIIRPPMVYGENCKGKFPELVQLVRLSPILPFKFTENLRSIVYIENLTQFIEHIIFHKTTGKFYPQDEKPVSIYELVLFIAKGLNQKKFIFRPMPLFLKILKACLPNTYERLYGNMFIDPKTNYELTGFKPLVSTQEAIAKTIRNAR